MARWHYDPTTPETIFTSFIELPPGYSDWDKAEQDIFSMAWEKALDDHRTQSRHHHLQPAGDDP